MSTPTLSKQQQQRSSISKLMLVTEIISCAVLEILAHLLICNGIFAIFYLYLCLNTILSSHLIHSVSFTSIIIPLAWSCTARPSLKLVHWLLQKRLEIGASGGKHPPIRWILEYWCDSFNFYSRIIPDLEYLSWKAKWYLSFEDIHDWNSRTQLEGTTFDEDKEMKELLRRFYYEGYRPHLPRAGEIICLYLADARGGSLRDDPDAVLGGHRLGARHNHISYFVRTLRGGFLALHFTVGYYLLRIPDLEKAREALDYPGSVINCLEEFFIYSVISDTPSSLYTPEMIQLLMSQEEPWMV